MEVRMDSQKGTLITGMDPVLLDIQQRLQTRPAEWLTALQQNPSRFGDLEQEIHRAFNQMADQVVAGLLAQTTAGADFADAAKKKVMPSDPQRKLRGGGEPRPLRLRLYGGLLVFVMTLYCSPARRTGKGRGGEGAGLYPELGVLGIQEGKSPALVRDIGRLTALLPSYEVVQQELLERGIKMTLKEVHGIGQHAGQAALAYRRRELEAYRAGTLPAADGKGKRFAAMIDGGRTKLRKTTRKQKGQGKSKTQRRRFQTAWREPKLLIVFEMDEEGRMKKGTKPIIDGTFEGSDAVMEVLVMRLHQIGASQADMVAFRADGAPWIWDRLEWVRQRLGLAKKQVSLGLDWCHAVHHISLALAPLLEGAERDRVFKKLRKWLKGGQWRKVTKELTGLLVAADLKPENEAAVVTAMEYLSGHGEAGRLDYAKYKRRGLPSGSGAIESAVRRVINLRMKGNSIFWEEENAEAMLVLRGLVLSRRWKEKFAKITESLASDRRLDWKWTPPDMVAQLKAQAAIKPPTPQPQSAETSYATAA